MYLRYTVFVHFSRCVKGVACTDIYFTTYCHIPAGGGVGGGEDESSCTIGICIPYCSKNCLIYGRSSAFAALGLATRCRYKTVLS